MMMAQGGVSLPAGYTKIEYLESDGNSYIDTGFKPNQDTRVVCDAQYNSTTLSQFLFGCRTSSSTNMFGIYTSSTNNSFIGVYNATQLAFSVSDLQSKRRFDQNKNVCKIGDKELSATYASFASSLNMYLFACNVAGETLYCSHLRLYSCKIYDNGTLVRDFIPAMNASGEAGLYDLTNDVWYALLPVAKPKVENKISLETRNYDNQIQGGPTVRFHFGTAHATYSVTSDVNVTVTKSDGVEYQLIIGNGDLSSPEKNMGFGNSAKFSITSISPTEDDTYIYTF